MKARCDRTGWRDYQNYGGRGITYDKRWVTFQGFWEDMSLTWQQGLSLDRIDVNGKYCKENCRWATLSEQQRNKRTTKLYEYDGKNITLTEISEITGTPYRKLHKRVESWGWSIDRAVNLRTYGATIDYCGELYTPKELAALFGLEYIKFKNSLRYKSPIQALKDAGIVNQVTTLYEYV